MIKTVLKLFLNPNFWLGLILIVGFLVRLYKIDNPIADWHSWRQADTAAVSRNFYKYGYNPFVPRYDDMSGVAEKPVPNPNRYRFVEFPIYNSLVYFTYLINGGVDEKLARLVSIVFSLGSTIFIYLITKRYFGVFTGVVASALFAILPFNIYFSRVILPEPSLVFFSLGMFYLVDLWLNHGGRKVFWGALLFTTAAFLTKPYAVFYLLPLIYVYYKKEKKWWPIKKKYLIFFVLAILPLLAWRFWISQHPEGIPASNWLFNGTHIRFKPAFWKWIIGDRFGREILSVAGTFLFFIGVLVKPKVRESLLLHLWVLCAFLFLIVFATGNVQHDYYQTFIVPMLVVFVARGFSLLLEGVGDFIPRIWTIPFAILFLVLTIYFGWIEVVGLYQINDPSIVEAGKVADRILPKSALVVAPYNGDTSFLYQINRGGFPVVAFPIDYLTRKFGITDYVSVTKDVKTKWVMRKYIVLVDSPKYVIVDLTRINPSFDFLHDSVEP